MLKELGDGLRPPPKPADPSRAFDHIGGSSGPIKNWVHGLAGEPTPIYPYQSRGGSILALDQPLPLRVDFEPTGARYSVRGGTNGEPKDCYVDLKAVEVGDEWIVEANLNDQAPSRTKTATLVIPVNDNDSTVIAWFLAKALRITGFRFARGETAAAALTMSVDKITASTAVVVAQLATAVDISGGTNGALQAFTPDESPDGDLPIDLTALQALAITVAAGSGTVAPRAVTVHIDYIELLQDGDALSIEVFG